MYNTNLLFGRYLMVFFKIKLINFIRYFENYKIIDLPIVKRSMDKMRNKHLLLVA